MIMKKIIICLLGAMLMLGCAGCGNMDLIDTTYAYNEAVLSLPNGEVIEGKVESWRDYEDGDQIQVKINGKTYLVHSEDVVLISNG